MKSQNRKLSEECFAKEDYTGYIYYAKLQYEESKDEEDKEAYEQAMKDYETYKEVQAVLKSNHENYYEVLGIAKEATLADIKQAFRSKASRCHPNRTKVHGASEATRIINKAYFEINTEEKKEAYDSRQKIPKIFQNMMNNDREFADQFADYSRMSFVFSSPSFRYSSGYPFSFVDDPDSFESFYRALYSQTRAQRMRRRDAPLFSVYIVYVLVIFVVIAAIL